MSGKRMKQKKETELVVQDKKIEIEEIKETIKEKKTLPKDETYKINKFLMKNIVLAVIVVAYFLFLNLGYMNIKNDVYIVDLKIFSMCILFIAILFIENAYKKDSGELAIYGIEMIVLSISSISMIYVNLMMSSRYIYIVSSISILFAIYYIIKTIVIYNKKKKEYFVNNMKEIIKDEE